MIKQDITYTDYNGAEHTEAFYFNLSRNDLIKLNDKYKVYGGLEEAFDKAFTNNDVSAAYNIFTDLIISAYGEKSEDGKSFRKSEDLREWFANSAAFEALFDDLTSNNETLLSFFKGMVPANLQNKAPLN